jgi:hypothetical protein
VDHGTTSAVLRRGAYCLDQIAAPAFRRGFYISAGPCGVRATNAVRHSGSVALFITEHRRHKPTLPYRVGFFRVWGPRSNGTCDPFVKWPSGRAIVGEPKVFGSTTMTAVTVSFVALLIVCWEKANVAEEGEKKPKLQPWDRRPWPTWTARLALRSESRLLIELDQSGELHRLEWERGFVSRLKLDGIVIQKYISTGRKYRDFKIGAHPASFRLGLILIQSFFTIGELRGFELWCDGQSIIRGD